MNDPILGYCDCCGSAVDGQALATPSERARWELETICAECQADQPLAQVIDLDAHRPHVVGFSTCRICGHRVVSVVDARADLNRLECSHCGAFDNDWEPDRGGPPGDGQQ